MTTPIGIEAARAAARRYLSESITIQDETRVRDTSGGTRTTYVSRPQPVRGWLSPPQDVEAAAVAGQVENRAAVVLTLPWGTPIAEGARCLVEGNGAWVVVALLSLPSATSVSVRVLLREVPS